MKFLILTCLAALAAFGCSPDVAVNTSKEVKVLANQIEKPLDLMPLTTGSAWTYEVRQTIRNNQGQTGSGEVQSTLKVTGRKGRATTVAVIQDNKVRSTITFAETDKGISQSHIKDSAGAVRSFDPPIPTFQWPMKLEETRTWTGSGYRSAIGSTGKMTSTLTYKGELELDTPAGRMRAHRFDTVQKYKSGEAEYGSMQSVWFVPKVGIARSLEISSSPQGVRETDMKLKTYTVK
ncbi:MAG: hypothetical protein M3R13_05035 [Armatimonadota bacterium]|nr:hypothetical protein [Armatimonadota bacterium]